MFATLSSLLRKLPGYAVASEKETQLCGMAVLPDKVKKKNKNRREMRRGRLRGTKQSRNTLKIASELCKRFPIKHIVVEDVQFNHYQKKWGKHFSTVEIGKTVARLPKQSQK